MESGAPVGVGIPGQESEGGGFSRAFLVRSVR